MNYIVLYCLVTIFLIYFVYDYCKKRKRLSKDGKILNKTFFGVLSFIFGLFYAFFIRIAISLGIVFGMLIYFNEISPFKVNTNEIRTESGKTIIFQGMTHMGTQDFYDKIEKIINEYTGQGYTVFFEGIHGGTEEDQLKLDQSLSIELRPDLYERVSNSFHGIVQQDYDSLFKGIKDETKLNNVDMSIDQLVRGVELKNEVTKNGEESKSVMNNINEETVKHLEKGKNNYLIQYILQGNLNLVSKMPQYLRLQLLKLNGADSDFFKKVIIDERNKNLAKSVFDSKEKKILIIYGQEHYKGFVEELKKLENVKNKFLVEEFTPFQ